MRIALLLCFLIGTVIRAQVWEPLNGPHTTEVTLVATSSNGHVFLGTAQGTLRSTDNGNTWAPMSIGPPGTYINKIVVAPNNHLFARGDSIYKSVDDGLTWVGLTTWPLNYLPTLFVVDEDGVLFAGNSWSAVLYTSVDEGDTWTSTPTPDVIHSLVDGPADTLYAGAGDGMTGMLLRSTDGGATWTTLISTPAWAAGVNASGSVFAAFDGTLNRSTNGGVDWTDVSLDVAAGLVGLEGTTNNAMFAVTVTNGVFGSLDNGDTWDSASNGLYSWLANCAATNDSDHVFVGTKAGLFRSTDYGANWTRVYSGADGSHISSLLTNSDNDYFVGVTSVGVFRSQDEGASWQAANSGMENAFVSSMILNSSGHMFATVQWGRNGVYRSVDNGNVWEHVLDSCFVRSIAINSLDHVFVVVAPGLGLPPLLMSIDNGATWTEASTGLACSSLRCVTVDSNDMVLVGGESCSPSLHSSVDNGTTWTAGASGLAADETVYSMAVGPSNVLFAASSDPTSNLFRSSDNAATWVAVGNGIPSFPNTVACHPDSGLVLVGTISGVSISGSNGDEWWPFNDGLANTNINALAIDQNGLALAGTAGGGVFRASLPVSVPEVAANDFTLDQNTPNPCDGITTITYSLRTAARVQLTLLDAHGRTVVQLVDATQPPGRSTVEVPTARLAPGLYAYALTVNGHRATKRMMVVH